MAKEPYADAKILIADDDPTSIRLLEKVLSDAGYQNIKTTQDPDQVEGLYQDIKPDLLILDLHMPHMEGFKIMERLRETEKEDYLPILVITQERNRVIQFSSLEAGAKDFLVKPYDSIEVLLRIRNFLEVRMLHNQVREQNRSLELKVRERTEQLYQSQIDTIHRLGRAIEYRDSETGIHTARMSLYIYHLTTALGFGPEECEIISTASSLHDIGKIAIPDSILKKPGKLTSDEMEIMKTHTTIGAKMLSGSTSKFLRMGEEIALTHHEKWDGTGYPNGLKGGDIPLVGRICGICDVFDALTCKRPYKEAWPGDDAFKEIRKDSGVHFDPHIVECFFKVMPQIRGVHEKYCEI
ncbi:MAG: response regulator [Candidatus Omnitrophica bacterium]|nr:response regulator [Candidatus Omnitrophota bacterium]